MKRYRMVGAILFLACALGFLGWRYRAAKPPVVATSPARGGEARSENGAVVRDEMHNRLLKALNLTPEQDAKMREIDKVAQAKMARGVKGPEVFRETVNEMAKVLTPEQMDNFRKLAMQGDREIAQRRVNKVLPPGELEKLEKKLKAQGREAIPAGESHAQ